MEKRSRSPNKKSQIGQWEDKDRLILLEGWARDGLTQKQIAQNMGIHENTLVKWKSRSEVISVALKKGKDVADYEVENALYKKALMGDVTACIFWLKNRKPEQWRDRKETPELNIMKRELELKEKKLELEKAKLEKGDDADAVIEVEDVLADEN